MLDQSVTGRTGVRTRATLRAQPAVLSRRASHPWMEAPAPTSNAGLRGRGRCTLGAAPPDPSTVIVHDVCAMNDVFRVI